MSGKKFENNQNKDETSFECNICLETAKDAVVSMCGHLFCWPCLHSWFEIKPENQVCPVCKAAISRDRVIPLYGRGFSKEDPRNKLPPRPNAHRTEPESENQSFPNFGFDIGGFQVAFGIGAFPFGIIASAFNFGDIRPPSVNQEIDDENRLNKTFLYLALIFFVWLLFA